MNRNVLVTIHTALVVMITFTAWKNWFFISMGLSCLLFVAIAYIVFDKLDDIYLELKKLIEKK